MDIQISYIIVFTIFIIVILTIIVISSIFYDSEDESVKVTKSFKLEPYSLNLIKPAIEYNSYTFTTPVIDNNISYILNGEFNKSCLSLYVNNEYNYSQIYDGPLSIILLSNLNLTTSSFKNSKFKTVILPLDNGKEYKVVVNRVNDLEILNYKVNYNIVDKFINYDKKESLGFNEYDLETYAMKNIQQIEKRVYPKLHSKYNEFILNEQGKFAIVYVENYGNYSIKFLNSNFDDIISKHNLNSVSIKTKYVDNLNILITNQDYQENVKDINTEYIDFITGPNYLLNNFLYGKRKKNINYNNVISDHIIIYKLSD